MTKRALLVASLAFASACGPHGYETSRELESRGQGPSGCAERCTELGMQMTALVLVGAEMSGCVCQPLETSGGIAPASTLVSAEAVLEVERRRRIAAAAAARRTTVR